MPNHLDLFVHLFFQPFVVASSLWAPWPTIFMIKKSEFNLIEELYFKKTGLKYDQIKSNNVDYFEHLKENKVQIVEYMTDIIG